MTSSILIACLAASCGARAATAAWTTQSPMPTARFGVTTCVVDGKIYAMAGARGPYDPYYSTVEVYDPPTDSWVAKSPMPIERNGHAAAVVSGQIYVLGGEPSNQASTDTVIRYDPGSDTWAPRAAMPTQRTFHCACTVDDKIYVMGGVTAGVAGAVWNPAGIDMYDPATDAWTTRGNMRTPRSGVGACALNGKIYVISGVIGSVENAAVPTVEAYDPALDTWVRKANLPAARAWSSVCAVGGRIYVVGGGSLSGGSSSRVDEYDPATDRWAARGNLRSPRFMLGASVVNGALYAIGGTVATWPWAGVATVESHVPPPVLSIRRVDATVEVLWTGILQETIGLADSPWRDIDPQPITPWTVPSMQETNMRCYRARVP
jgi:N-acetylneuraminic acid mutarotase